MPTWLGCRDPLSRQKLHRLKVQLHAPAGRRLEIRAGSRNFLHKDSRNMEDSLQPASYDTMVLGGESWPINSGATRIVAGS